MLDANYVISTVGKPDYVEKPDDMFILMPFLNGGDLLEVMKRCVHTEGCWCTKDGISRTCWEKMGICTAMHMFWHSSIRRFWVCKIYIAKVLFTWISSWTISCWTALRRSVSEQFRSCQLWQLWFFRFAFRQTESSVRCSAWIIDFGIAAEFGTRMPSGTPGYMAPEVMKIFGSSQPQSYIFPWALFFTCSLERLESSFGIFLSSKLLFFRISFSSFNARFVYGEQPFFLSRWEFQELRSKQRSCHSSNKPTRARPLGDQHHGKPLAISNSDSMMWWLQAVTVNAVFFLEIVLPFFHLFCVVENNVSS